MEPHISLPKPSLSLKIRLRSKTVGNWDRSRSGSAQEKTYRDLQAPRETEESQSEILSLWLWSQRKLSIWSTSTIQIGLRAKLTFCHYGNNQTTERRNTPGT